MTAANTTWKQISIHTKMACGARKAIAKDENTLVFQVGGKPMRYIEVALNCGQDLYEVEYYRIKRGKYERISLEKHEMVGCEMLNELIYNMVNTRNG